MCTQWPNPKIYYRLEITNIVREKTDETPRSKEYGDGSLKLETNVLLLSKNTIPSENVTVDQFIYLNMVDTGPQSWWMGAKRCIAFPNSNNHSPVHQVELRLKIIKEHLKKGR